MSNRNFFRQKFHEHDKLANTIQRRIYELLLYHDIFGTKIFSHYIYYAYLQQPELITFVTQCHVTPARKVGQPCETLTVL